MHIGEIIKKLRGEMTQAELAKRAGLNFTTISIIEGGHRQGTISAHLKIAKALGITLSELYKGFDNPTPPLIEVTSKKREQVDVFYYNDKAVSQILVKQISKRKMGPEILRLEKGGITHLEKKTVGTEQFIHMLEGKVEIKIGEETLRLKKGESIYFDASLAHQIKNISNKTTSCLRVSSPATL